MKFYLGIHMPQWLEKMTVPAFVSYSSLRGRKTFPRSGVPWCHDSRGFTEIEAHGRYTFTAKQYAEDVRRASREIGRMKWASILDWMCEPHIIGKTGLSIREHQRRTVDSLLELRAIAPDIHWAPVLQGWDSQQYLDCIELYEDSGVDLHAEPIVGLGSVCRRQGTQKILSIVRNVMVYDLRLHGFGVKASGIDLVGEWFDSFDSQAWSSGGRRRPPIGAHRTAVPTGTKVAPRKVGNSVYPFEAGTTVAELMLSFGKQAPMNGAVSIPVYMGERAGWIAWEPAERRPWFATHRNCANCLDFAMQWRESTIEPRIVHAEGRRQWIRENIGI
jgi:hypothetical protein